MIVPRVLQRRPPCGLRTRRTARPGPARVCSRGWKGEHPQRHLKDFHGILQADAYAGFGHLYGTDNIQEAACMAHARRKFHDIHEVHPSPITTEALDRIGALYRIEREIRGHVRTHVELPP